MYIQLEYKDQKNSTKIFSKEIREYSNKLVVLTEKMKGMVSNTYLKDISELWNDNKDTLKYIVDFIGFIDVIKSFAKTSFEYRYVKPNIVEHSK